MENKIATTVEQSKKLLELGIDSSTADMTYSNASNKGINYTDKFKLELITPKEAKEILDMSIPKWDTFWELIPAWSLSALLGILDPMIVAERLQYSLLMENDNKYYVVKYFSTSLGQVKRTCEKNLVDAVFEMIVYLKENKLI